MRMMMAMMVMMVMMRKMVRRRTTTRMMMMMMMMMMNTPATTTMMVLMGMMVMVRMMIMMRRRMIMIMMMMMMIFLSVFGRIRMLLKCFSFTWAVTLPLPKMNLLARNKKQQQHGNGAARFTTFLRWLAKPQEGLGNKQPIIAAKLQSRLTETNQQPARIQNGCVQELADAPLL